MNDEEQDERNKKRMRIMSEEQAVELQAQKRVKKAMIELKMV